MSDTREQQPFIPLEQEEQQAIQAARQQQEQAAARTAVQAEQRVDTWMKENSPRIQQAWERSTEGIQRWGNYAQQSPDAYDLARQHWQREVRTPAVEHAVAQEAVREGIVPPVAAERYLSQSNIVFDHGDIGRREVSLQEIAGDIAYEQTLEQGKTPRRDVPSPEPAGREDRALTLATIRDQAERSPEMAARGWGQSWDAQQHEQGWHR